MLFRRTQRKPIPEGAKITRLRSGQRIAKWTDARGDKQEARVSEDGQHVLVEAGKWTARYRDASGRLVQKPTGCERLEFAQSKLSDWLAIEEKRRAGIITASEAGAAEWAHVDIENHVSDYEKSLTGQGRSAAYIKKTAHTLRKAFKALRFSSIQDLNRSKAERWLHGHEGMGARNHNLYATALICFGNWLVKQGRAGVNPFAGMSKRNERLDRRHVRRVLSDAEIAALLEAARTRPLTERAYKNISEDTREERRFLGETRALAYETMVLTGLRYSELKSVLLGDCHFTDPLPYVTLRATHEKNRKGSQIPIPGELARRLEEYRLERRSRLLGHCSVSLPHVHDKAPLFDLPQNMVKVFNQDAAAAGLVTVTIKKDKKGRKVNEFHKADPQGRTIDIHALRHTFCDRLVKSGVSVATAQKAMRHSDPRLTLGVYAHIGLEETSAAVNALPEIPKNCEAVQVANLNPENVSPKTSLGTGILSLVEAQKDTFSSFEEEPKNAPKTAKTPVKPGFLNGGPCWNRTSDQVIMSHLL